MARPISRRGSATSGRTPISGTSPIEPRSPATCPEKGIQLPTGFATTIDFRNVVQSKLYVDRNIVDAPIDDLSAPASVRSARPRRVHPGGQREPAADQGRRPCLVHERQHVLRIRRPPHDGRGEPHGCRASGDPQGGQCARSRQARDAGDPDASPLRPQRRTSRGRGRRVDGHLTPGQRGHLPRDGGASRPSCSRTLWDGIRSR